MNSTPIKYRGYSDELKSFSYGFYQEVEAEGKVYSYIFWQGNSIGVLPESVSPFTGYHDSEKTELFGKDIVEFKIEDEHDPSGYRTIRCVIEQINGCWVFCEIGFDYSKLRFPVEYSFVCEDAHEGRKIGDAHSNPELLK